MRTTAWLVCAVLIVCCVFTDPAGAGGESKPREPGTQSTLGLDPDEYDALSVLIDSLYAYDFELIVISPRTERWCINAPLSMLLEQWPDLKQETIDSLIVRNGMQADLADRFTIDADCRFVTEAEYKDILREPLAPDWDGFDSMFVDAQGYLVVSRAGFDAGRTQALVYFSNAYRCSGSRIHHATRSIAYLRKIQGAWAFVGVVRGLPALY